MKIKFYVIILFSFNTLLMNAQSWNYLGSGMDNWVTVVKADYLNNIIYAGGSFHTAGGNSISYIAKWDGSSWAPLGSGVDQPVHALEIINGELYVGGEFLNAGGNPATRIAKYNGLTWTALGAGLGGSVNAIAEYNGEIYAGGLDGLKKWDGLAWSNVGSGIGGAGAFVTTLKVLNGELWVGGSFATAGGLTANGIASWDGISWSIPGGSGLNSSGIVYAMELYNGLFFIGGDFTSVGGTSASCLAYCDGSYWYNVNSSISGGLPGTNPSVNALTFLGTNLIIGGNFDHIDGTPVNYLASYDANTFSEVDNGTDAPVLSLDNNDGNLVVGGQFLYAGGNGVNHIAEWGMPTAIKDLMQGNKILIYPNPSSDYLTIEFKRTIINGKIEILNLLGEIISTENIFSLSKKEINIHNIPKGLYFVKVDDGDENFSEKIVVN